MAYVDSNIWCYYIDSRLPEHHHVIGPIREMLNSSEVFVNTVTVMEVTHYLTRSLDANTARDKIDAFVNLSSLRILDFDKDTMNASIDLLSKHGRSKGLGGRDSTILASIIQNNIDTVLTHDNVLKNVAEIQGIRIIDPVGHN